MGFLRFSFHVKPTTKIKLFHVKHICFHRFQHRAVVVFYNSSPLFSFPLSKSVLTIYQLFCIVRFDRDLIYIYTSLPDFFINRFMCVCVIENRSVCRYRFRKPLTSHCQDCLLSDACKSAEHLAILKN